MEPHEHTLAGCLRITLVVAALSAVVAGGGGFVVWQTIARKKVPVGCNGSAARGQQLVVAYGCTACHEIPDAQPHGMVGPSLDHIGSRSYIAGRAANEPIMMQQWLQHPARVKPGTAMPDLGVNERDARDITAYLATLE